MINNQNFLVEGFHIALQLRFCSPFSINSDMCDKCIISGTKNNCVDISYTSNKKLSLQEGLVEITKKYSNQFETFINCHQTIIPVDDRNYYSGTNIPPKITYHLGKYTFSTKEYGVMTLILMIVVSLHFGMFFAGYMIFHTIYARYL
jgi:hypothetical protein